MSEAHPIVDVLQAAAERYGFADSCTWHGPLALAGRRRSGARCCPMCGSSLQEMPAGEFWATVRKADQATPGTEDLQRWSEGRCFPDHDTMLNAYRQAMEE